MTEIFRSRALGHSLIGLFLVIWLVMLGTRTLVPTDEGRYAEIPREMVFSGDWVTPRLNGVKYFYKPPLQSWFTAATYEVFGEGDWQARLWAGLNGLLGIALVWIAGRRLFGREVGLAAALVLGSSFWWTALGHINTLDMGLSGMMTLALCGLLIAQDPRTDAAGRRRWMLACWAGMALAVMCKGLIGLVLPGAVLVLYTLISRDWGIWKRLHLWSGLLVFLAITAPWFILVSIANPEFPNYFFIHEHFSRFTSTVHRRSGPWFYFLPMLALGTLPWLSMLAQGLYQGLLDRRTTHAGMPREFQPRLLLLIWAVFIFSFFSISSSKLPSYILPIYPALALLIGLYIKNAGRAGFRAAGLLSLGLGIAALIYCPQIPGMTDEALEIPYYAAAIPWVIATGIVLICAGLGTLFFAHKLGSNQMNDHFDGANSPGIHYGLRATFALAAGGFLASQLLLMATEPYGRYRSGAPLLPILKTEITPQTRLYGVGILEHTLPFYLERTFTMALHPDELAFGLEQEPNLWHPDIESFTKAWLAPGKAIAFVHPGTMLLLEKNALPMRIVARDTRRWVIANDHLPSAGADKATAAPAEKTQP